MPDVDALASELRLAVHRMTRRLRQQTPTEGLTLTQLSALSVVWREGPLTAGDLAVKEQVRPPSITRGRIGVESANFSTPGTTPWSNARQPLPDPEQSSPAFRGRTAQSWSRIGGRGESSPRRQQLPP